MCVRDADSPVWFTPASPLDVPSGALVYYSVVPPNVVSRCSILSCIAEAEGQARLPDAVSVSDFRAWLTAVPWTIDAQKSRAVDFNTLCTAAKVADVLDDTRASAWVNSVTERLIDLLPGSSLGADDGDVHSGHAAATSLSSLPHHIQYQVFAATVARFHREGQQPYLHRLLDWLPQSFRPTIVEAAITHGKELTFELTDRCVTCIETVAALPCSPPQILSMQLRGQPISAKSDWAPQHLARLLRHHSGLSKLVLGNLCSSSEVFAAVAPVLPALTSLLSLSLGTSDAPLAENSFPNLRSALISMPGLVELNLSLIFDQQSGERQDDAREDLDAPALHMQQRTLATTVSPATALTSLSIDVHQPGLDQELDLFLTSERTWVLPNLTDLSIEVDSCRWATALLSELDAPLTSLTIGEGNEEFVNCDENLELDIFVSRLSRFELQCLRVLPACNGDHEWPEQALAMMLAAQTSELKVLQRLRFLHCDADSDMQRSILEAAPRLTSVLPRLESLTLTGGYSDLAGEQWAIILRHLCELPLQKVSLDLEYSGLAASDLVPLTGLSALRLDGCLNLAAPDCVLAFAQMTQLQCLQISGFLASTRGARDAGECMHSLVLRLAALPGLISLALTDCQAPLDGLAAAGVNAPWRALRRLALFIEGSHQQAALRTLIPIACTLPTLETLVLECKAKDDNDAEGRDGKDQDDADLTEEERLQQTAKRSGVALSFKKLSHASFMWL